MTNTPKTLSDAGRTLLTLAATQPNHLVRPPQLPVAAARQVIRSLLKAGLLDELPVPNGDATSAWRTGADGVPLMLRATALGLAAIGKLISPEPPQLSAEAVATPEMVDTAIAIPPQQGADVGGPPRTTKQAQVLAMLRRDEGASVPAIAAAMGWAPHTVRGFLAGLQARCSSRRPGAGPAGRAQQRRRHRQVYDLSPGRRGAGVTNAQTYTRVSGNRGSELRPVDAAGACIIAECPTCQAS